MKQLIIPGIITLAIGLIVAYFTHNLNKEYVDLRYSLSERIPTKFRETSPAESVQQLVVKNNGNIAAIQIQIKLDASIEDYDLLKNAISDVVDVHKSTSHFEAIYPALPPEGQFVFIFKTVGSGMSSRDIEIKHNKGKAQEALSGDKRLVYERIFSYLPVSLLIFYIIMFLIQGRSMAITHLEGKGSYTNYYDYLNKKKPFYISSEKWNSIRREYIKERIKARPYSYNTNIEEFESYKILNSDKPIFVAEDEWELLKEKAIKSLEDELSAVIKATNPYHNLDTLEKYFLLKRPKHVLDHKWHDIVKKINDNYVIIRKRKAARHRSLEVISKEIENGMPSGMLPEYWADYKEYLVDLYYELAYSNVLRRNILINDLKAIDPKIINKDRMKDLEDTAYKIGLSSLSEIANYSEAEAFIKSEKPEWLAKKDLDKLERKAESHILLDKALKRNATLQRCINDILKMIPLNNKPECLDDIDWDALLKLETQIIATTKKLADDKALLESEKEETILLKNKILNQLAIIDRILIQPDAINKIEDYDNPFSEGNLSNLRKIAALGLKINNSSNNRVHIDSPQGGE